MGNKFYVYTITSRDSGEVLYVGKGSGLRWKTSLKRIEELSCTQCEVFIEEADSNELALQKETKLIQSLIPKYNKNVSWRKIKTGSSLAKLSITIPFEVDLVSITKTHAGFNYELVQVGDSLFKLLITKSGEGFETAEFSLSTKRSGVLRITASGTGVTEPSKASIIEHRLVYAYVLAAFSSVQNSLNTLGYDFTLDVTQAEWSDLKFGFDYKGIFNTDLILRYFTGICGRVERSSEKALGVAQEIGFIFKDFVSTDGTPCGIRMEKMSGNFNTFTLAMYRKDLEVKDREKRGQKVSKQEKEVNLEELASVLRVEGQIYPKTFYRGKCARFRKIMLGEGGGKGKQQDYWHSVKFLEDSATDVEKLRQCLGEMSSQLGLHLIFSAWPYKSVESAVLSLAVTPRQVDAAEKWIEDNESKLTTKGLSGRAQIDIAEFANRVYEELGIDMYSISLMTFGWIRNALLYSQLTTQECKQLALLDPTSEEDHVTRKALVNKAAKRAVLCRKQLLGLRDGFWMLAEGSIPDISIN